MASGIYNIFKLNLMNKVIDLEADTINVALFDDTYTFDATDTAYATILTDCELANGNGYTTAGAALASKAVTDSPTGTAKFDAADTAWAAATWTTARFAIIYDVTLAGTNDLIACIDFGADQSVTAGTFTIVWNSAGIITLT